MSEEEVEKVFAKEDWNKDKIVRKLPDNIGDLNELRDAYFHGTPPSVISNAIFSNVAIPADYTHPMTLFRKGEEITENVMFFAFFGNVSAISTREGIVLVDAGGFGAKVILSQLNQWRPSSPIHTVIYSHGHMDHVFGMRTFDRAYKNIRVVAHKNVSERFKRYVNFNSYNKQINGRQFVALDPKWPKKWREADETYDEKKELIIGDEIFQLFHDKGETDDSTWVWLPRRRVLITGDLFIWTFPNCGNPQKVQRYAVEWAEALKKMRALSPLFLLPGHGPPILGKENIERALSETIEALELIIDHTIKGINEGKRLQQIVDSLEIPDRLLSRPYLQPIYDEPQFIVRNLWRLYAGWWDGEATHLKPVKEGVIAAEIAQLVGGAKILSDRALSLLSQNQTPLACHLIQMAHDAEPDNADITAAYQKIFAKRSEESESVMARGIYKFFSDHPPHQSKL